MSDETPKTVTVKAITLHTYEGKTYNVGDTYEIDAVYADSVVGQRKAERVAAPVAAQKKTKDVSTAVTPMTSADFLKTKG